MSLEEKIKNGTTELQEFYAIAQRDIEKHSSKIKILSKELELERKQLVKALNLKSKCEIRAIEQGYPHLFR